eukprot:jgi/Chlat1/6038/Chrsp4S06205
MTAAWTSGISTTSAQAPMQESLSPSWDPAQYLAFRSLRERPGTELLAAIHWPRSSSSSSNNNRPVVYDLGCGTGNLTTLLARRFPTAKIIGVDSSPEMLEKAKKTMPEAKFMLGDLTSWSPPREKPDIIYSNSVFHWVDNHDAIFPKLVGYLSPGGVLAISMPNNFHEASHVEAHALARSHKWRVKLSHVIRDEPVKKAEAYYDMLAPVAKNISIWTTEYLQVLKADDEAETSLSHPVVEWIKGSWLRQFLDRLNVNESLEFEAEYAVRMRAAYPIRPRGVVLFPFKRMFIVADAL